MRHPLRAIGDPLLLSLRRSYALSPHRAICSGGEDALSGAVVLLSVVSFIPLPNLLRAVGVVGLRNIAIRFLRSPELRKFARSDIAGEEAPPLNQAGPSFGSVATTCL